MHSAIAWYSQKLAQRPLLTKACTSSVLFGIGDILKRNVEARVSGEQFSWSWESILKSSLFGACIAAPTLHLWYSKTLPIFFSTQTLATSVSKTLVDQMIFGPYFLGILLTSASILKDFSLAKAQAQVKQDYELCIKANWSFWPCMQLFNFYIIPLQFQVLYINIIGVFWNAYLWGLRAGNRNNE